LPQAHVLPRKNCHLRTLKSSSVGTAESLRSPGLISEAPVRGLRICLKWFGCAGGRHEG
jgi:hypothetical protein